MLDDLAIAMIEGKIGYSFKNKELLTQAFTRSSFAEEDRMHGGKGLSNEQLEFYGDSVLNYIIVDELTYEETTMDKDGNIHSRSQAELTNFVSFWTDKTMLSQKMQELDLFKYLLLGKGDIKQNVGNNKGSKEDLFESIIGAMWFDSNKDLNQIKKSVYKMLNLNFDDVCFKKNRFTELKEKLDKINSDKDNATLGIIKADMSFFNKSYIFELTRENEMLFVTQPESKDYHIAQLQGADLAIQYLDENFELINSRKKINPELVTEANAIQSLIRLFQLHIISVMPEQTEKFDYDKNLWYATVKLGDGSVFIQADKVKAVARNKAALQAFKYAYENAGIGNNNGKAIKF